MPALPERASQTLSQTQNGIGQTVTYTCDTGFEFVGDAVEVNTDVPVTAVTAVLPAGFVRASVTIAATTSTTTHLMESPQQARTMVTSRILYGNLPLR